MGSDEFNRIPGISIAFAVYFVILLICATWANRRNREEVSAPDQITVASSTSSSTASTRPHGGGDQHQRPTTDTLSSHYLSGRSLGPLLTTGTIFASFFSGYSVVGIPNEAYQNGWMATRWVVGAINIQLGYFGTSLRFRKAALVRNHKTPLDFITDRFQCQILRYTVLILQVVPSAFYIAGQVVSLKSTCNTVFDLDPKNPNAVAIIMSITLLLEWIGGLRCVAMTDCIQGSIMVLAYACLPIIIAKHFGGWRELTPETYPRPEFYETPSMDMQWKFWQYTMSTFTIFTFPHLMQRTYAAKDLKSLKTAYTSMACGIWFLQVGAIYVGTMAVEILRDEDHKVASPFHEVLGRLIDLGGFPKVVALLTVTASLAAIMSTVDSLLVAISQLITEEVVYPIKPNATPKDMAWVGRTVSFVAVISSTLMGLSWHEGVTEVGVFNFQLSSQAIFIFIIGLFGTERFDCHPWNLAASAILGTVYVFSIQYGYLTAKEEERVPPISAGVTAIAVQAVIITVLEVLRRAFLASGHVRGVCEHCAHSELLFPHRPDWDLPRRCRFGENPLTPKLIWKMMKGVNEPLANPWFALLMFISVSLTCPWVSPGIPTNMDDLVDSAVNGIPWWAVKILCTSAFPAFFVFCSLYNMPHRFPHQSKSGRPGEDSIDLSDPDVMEMTPEELGYRIAYDQRNDMVYKRRREILEKLGISPTEIDTIVESSRQHLQDFQPPF